MKVSDLTIEELKEIISDAIETKLKETIGDPDWGIELRKDIRERLRNSLEAVEKGKKGIPLSEIASRAGLEN